MLKRASRARSLVGRTVSPAGAASRRPRWLPPTMRIALPRTGLAAAELLVQHLPRHLLDRALCQMAELKGAVREADEPRHRIAEVFEDAAHLTVLALAERQCQPGVGALLAVECRADRAVGDAVDRHAAG